jgi:FtsH-binding integral membrane protein
MTETNPFTIQINSNYNMPKYEQTPIITSSLSSRQLFIIKTYLCLAVQLFVTFAITLAFFKSPTLQSATSNQLYTLLLVCICIGLVSLFVTYFGVEYMNSNLCASIPFSLFTISMSIIFAIGAIDYSMSTVIQSVASVSIVFFGCTAFILITKKDLHSWSGFLFCGLFGLVITSFVFIFFPPSNLVDIVYNIIGIIIFIGYVLFDTSELIHSYLENQYFLASMNIYLDILNLLLKTMKLISWAKGEKN